MAGAHAFQGGDKENPKEEGAEKPGEDATTDKTIKGKTFEEHFKDCIVFPTSPTNDEKSGLLAFR